MMATATETANDDLDLITPAEAAAILRVEPKTLANWRTSRRCALPYHRFGNKIIRYKRREVAEFVARGMVSPRASQD